MAPAGRLTTGPTGPDLGHALCEAGSFARKRVQRSRAARNCFTADPMACLSRQLYVSLKPGVRHPM